MVHPIFEPREKIRQINMKEYIGRKFTYELGRIGEHDGSQWINPCRKKYPNTYDDSTDPNYDYVLHQVNGWTNGVTLGEPGDRIELIVKDAFLIQHNNGGRSDHKRYYSYWEYFDTNKNNIFKYKNAGFLGKLQSGDVDRCDVCFEFENGIRVEGMAWEIVAPQEWDSERVDVTFPEGFYETPEEAVEQTMQKKNDDLFGERYFPVIVFDEDTDVEKIREIMWRPKSHSTPIVKDGKIIIGTRCKPHEVDEVIFKTYELNGTVAKKQWDWE